ncbi:M23 family metallopeptidase [Leptolyngbya sp. BC1307]|uniref:M23 family metallopeptidase n=1 Tax=Leptolyngbya sp. BC1307 TaxID=2029589 RepID=UPI000EFDA9BE|nr:M23 family metallopeptidase [Leptolyngbya sp. BC1307]
MVLLHQRWQRGWQRYVGFGLAIALAFCLITGDFAHGWQPSGHGAAAQAQTLDNLRQQRDQVDQQLKIYDQTDQRYQTAEQQADQQLRDLSKTIQGTDAWISDTEYQLGEAERRLNQLQADLTSNQQTYEESRTAAVGRLQFMQRQQEAQGWALLLQSQNLNDFLDRRYRLKQVYQTDRTALMALEAAAAELVAQQEGVEQQKNSIALLRQQLMASRQQYAAQVQQQSEMMTRLQENRGALSAAINQLDKDSANLTELILERVAAADGINSKMAREEALRAARSSGRMVRPSLGPITSQFGRRFHPVLGYSRFHAGTDFGAAHGTPILAAESGVVIFAGWYGGYGNAVIIDHGAGVTTLYGHASRLNVQEGEAVKQGDAIAAVGTTGLSTGPHLHFEVRHNGEPTDPMAFL